LYKIASYGNVLLFCSATFISNRPKKVFRFFVKEGGYLPL